MKLMIDLEHEALHYNEIPFPYIDLRTLMLVGVSWSPGSQGPPWSSGSWELHHVTLVTWHSVTHRNTIPFLD